MIFIKWLFNTILMIIVWALSYLLGPVLPLFARDTYGPSDNNTTLLVGPRLPSWLSWFQTPDNNLTGDFGWKVEHWQWRYALPEWLATYVGMVGWIWRNPACGVGNIKVTMSSIMQAKVYGNLFIADSPFNPGFTLITSSEFFQFRIIKKIPFISYAFSCNFGWNVTGYVKDPINEFGNDPTKEKTAILAFSPIRKHKL
jgi:hypothetical protein